MVLWILLFAFGSVLFYLYIFARRLEQLAKQPTPVWLHKPNASAEISHRKDTKLEVDFSFVIPSYNEDTRILTTLESTTAFLEELTSATSLTYEIVIVDDGSKDKTLEVVQNFVQFIENGSQNFRVYQLHSNCGKGVAVTEGLLRARGALCLFMDADGATEITEFRSLHQSLMTIAGLSRERNIGPDLYLTAAEKSALVVGSRSHLQSKATAQRTFWRNLLMHGFHALVYLVSFTDVRDTQCGFKLFTRKAVHQIFPHLKIRRWCFDVEILILAKRLKIAKDEVEVKWREIPGSKVRIYHIFHMAWELAVIFVGYSFIPSWWIWKQVK